MRFSAVCEFLSVLHETALKKKRVSFAGVEMILFVTLFIDTFDKNKKKICRH